MQDVTISDKQAKTIANLIMADILAYCEQNAAAFEEFKKTLKEDLPNESKSSQIVA